MSSFRIQRWMAIMWYLFLLLKAASAATINDSKKGPVKMGGPPVEQLCSISQRMASPTLGNPVGIKADIFQPKLRHLLWYCSAIYTRYVKRDDYMRVYTVVGTGDIFRLSEMSRRRHGYRLNPSFTVYKGCEDHYDPHSSNNNIFDHNNNGTSASNDTVAIQDESFFYNGEYASPCTTESEYFDNYGITWKTVPDQVYVIVVFVHPSEPALAEYGATNIAFRLKVHRIGDICDDMEPLGDFNGTSSLSLRGNQYSVIPNDPVIYDHSLSRCNQDGLVDSPGILLRTFRVLNGSSTVVVQVTGYAKVMLYKHPAGVCSSGGENHNRTWACAAVTSDVYFEAEGAEEKEGWSIDVTSDTYIRVFADKAGSEFLLVIEVSGPFEVEIASAVQDDICASSVALSLKDLDGKTMQGTLNQQAAYNLTLTCNWNLDCDEKATSFPFQLFAFNGTGEHVLLRVESQDYTALDLKVIKFDPVNNQAHLSCSPDRAPFSCSGQNWILFPTVVGKTHHVGLAGCGNENTDTRVTNGKYDLDVSLYPVGNLYNDTTNLGMVGNDRIFLHEDSLEEEAFVYQVLNTYACTSRGHGPGRVFTMTMAQSGRIDASVNSTSSPDSLRVDVFRGSYDSCREGSSRYVEAGEVISIFVFAHRSSHSMAATKGSFVLQVKMEAAEPLCTLWKRTSLGELGPRGLRLRGSISENDLEEPLLYSFTVSGDVNRLRLELRGYGDFDARASLYEPTAERCYNQISEERRWFYTTTTWATKSSTTYLILVTSGGDESPSSGDFDLELVVPAAIDPCVAVVDLSVSTAKAAVVESTTYKAPLNGTSLCSGTTSPTLLYSFVAESSGTMRARLQTHIFLPSLRLSVFKGECASFTCIHEESIHGQGSREAFWSVSESERYYVAVHGRNEDDHGDFTLLVGYEKTVDICSEAQPLQILNESRTVIGSTSNASLSGNVEACGGIFRRITVYSLKLNWSGALVGSVSGLQSENMRLEMYEGSCEEPFCHDAGIARRILAWPVQSSKTYYLVIWACCYTDAAGDFELTIQPISAPDVCGEGIVDLGMFTGETIYRNEVQTDASFFNVFPQCRDRRDSFQSSSLVYKLTTRGFDGNLTASVQLHNGGQFEEKPYEAFLTVYRGDCASPQCVEEVRLSQYDTSQQWTALDGETYYIMVHGSWPGQLGSFSLEVSLSPSRNFCVDRWIKDLGILPPPVSYTWKYSRVSPSETPFDNIAVCGGPVSSAMNVFSLVSPTFGNLSIGVNSFEMNPTLGVFRSSCTNEIICSSYQSLRNATLAVIPNEVLFIAVFDCCDDTATGDFVLDIEFDMHRASICDSITELPSVAGERMALTMAKEDFRFLEEFPSCDDNKEVLRWAIFSLIGTGDVVSISTYDPLLYNRDYQSGRKGVCVFQGTCEELVLVGDGRFAFGRKATWVATEGVQYFIAVSEEMTGGRDFVLSIDGRGTRELNFCSDAIHVGNVSTGDVIEMPRMVDRPIEDGNRFNIVVSFTIKKSQTMLLSMVADQMNLYKSGCSIDSEHERIGQYGSFYSRVRWLSTVEWSAVEGETYFLVESSYHDVEDPIPTMRFDSIEERQLCDAAVNLGRLGVSSLVLNASTSGAAAVEKGLACAEYTQTSPALVYAFNGTGDELVFNVVEASLGTGFYFGLFEGTSCTSLLRLTPEYFWGGYRGDARVWSVKNATYYLTVSACKGPREFLEITLTAQSYATSGLCQNASVLIDIPVDGNKLKLQADTDTATPFYDFHKCTETRRDPTVVYQMFGDGRTYQAQLANSADKNSSIYVSYGNCTFTTCFESTGRVQQSWATKEGVTYFIAIVGNNPSNRGGFTLHLGSVSVLSDCGSDSLATFPEGELLLPGTTRNGTLVSGVLGDIAAPVAAFVFVGNDMPYLLSLEVIASDSGVGRRFNPAVELFEGSCGNLSRVEKASSASYLPILFTPPADQIYTIVVYRAYDWEETEGDFVMILSRLSVGDINRDAINTTVAAGERKDVRGSTSRGALYFDDLPRCYEYSSTRQVLTVLYRLVGLREGIMVASPYYLDQYRPRVAVYKTSIDSTLTCVGQMIGNNVEWKPDQEAEYYVAIFASYPDAITSISDYALILSSALQEDSCDQIVDLGMVEASASFVCSSMIGQIGQDPILSSGEDTVHHRLSLVHHKVQGNGERLTAILYLPSRKRAAFSAELLSGFCGSYSNYGHCCVGDDASISWNSGAGIEKILTVATLAGAGDYFLSIESEGSEIMARPPSPTVTGVCSTLAPETVIDPLSIIMTQSNDSFSNFGGDATIGAAGSSVPNVLETDAPTSVSNLLSDAKPEVAPQRSNGTFLEAESADNATATKKASSGGHRTRLSFSILLIWVF